MATSSADLPLLVYGPHSTTYDFGPSHPLTPRRFATGISLLEGIGAVPNLAPEPATDDELGWIHDEAYIETERCSTCNECTQINNKMFAYNANQQAYIADINAGTYAQLVEAAESCQVAIIHPGKPRNPNEPGLEELLKRAEAVA